MAAPLPVLADTVTIVGSDTASAGNFAQVRSVCPEGKVALSGGLDPENVLQMSMTASAPVFAEGDFAGTLFGQPNGTSPAPIGWQADARNDAAGGTLGIKVGAVCVNAPEPVVVVGSDTASPGDFAQVRSLCPEGKSAVGGGLDPENVLQMSVTASAPVFAEGSFAGRLSGQPDGTSPAPIGWQADARNDSAGALDIKVGAVCASVSGAVVVVGSDTASPGDFAQVRVLCPEGTEVVGGGIDSENVLSMTVTASAPVFAEGDFAGRLSGQPDGTRPAPVGWQADARNDSGGVLGIKVGVICVPEPSTNALAGAALLALAGCASRASRRSVRGAAGPPRTGGGRRSGR